MALKLRCKVPERILDAPEIVNDYYLNLLDWSRNNYLAVALGAHIYLWNAGSGEITELMELEGPEDYVCSVRCNRHSSTSNAYLGKMNNSR